MILKEINRDLEEIGENKLLALFSNRGIHALAVYRISNLLYRNRIPLLPLVFTRIIQIFYAIDIDYRANIEPGVKIMHGVGVVIGKGCKIGRGTKIYQGVTLGISERPGEIGFPILMEGVIVSAGAKIIGGVTIGKHAIIGANAVVVKDVPANSTAVGVPAKIIRTKEHQ